MRTMPIQHDLTPAGRSSPVVANGLAIAAFRSEDDAQRCAHGLGMLRERVEAKVVEVKGAKIIYGRYPWVVSIARGRGQPVVALAYVTGFTDAVGEGIVLR